MSFRDLAQLFTQYGTDKNVVGYTAVYQALFDRWRDSVTCVLEIGIGTMCPGVHSSMQGFALPGYRPGGSLRAWRDYFPYAVVHGVDVQPDTQFTEERIMTHLCDSRAPADVSVLFQRLLGLSFDVIIDDGSHIDTDQLQTLQNFYPHLREGGFYIIEDIHPDAVMLKNRELILSRCNGAPFFFAGANSALCVIHKRRDSSRAGARKRTPRVVAGGILMYHRINELDVDPHGLCVPPAEFRQQMGALIDRHPIVPLEEFTRGVVDGTLPPAAVAITFDDGTLDTLEYASPVLLELGIPATFFINSARCDEIHEPWWDELARIFLGDGDVPDHLELRLDGAPVVFATHGGVERMATHGAIHRWLLRATRPERERVLAHVVDWSGIDLSPRDQCRLLLPDEVRELAARPGHTIGGHSVSHVWLPGQPAEEKDWEIEGNRRDLERIVGGAITLFSYPYGGYDRDTVQRVRRCGFRAAVSTEPGIVSFGGDIYALPRFDVRAGQFSRIAGALGETLAMAGGVTAVAHVPEAR